MPEQPDVMIDDAPIAHGSPHTGLHYRSIVFARLNRGIPLYYVGGVAGGPWSATKALATSHKFHGGNCFYCKKKVAKGKASVDHVEPTVAAGSDALQNLVISCKPCNAKKGHKVLDLHNPQAAREWLEALLLQIQERLNRLA